MKGLAVAGISAAAVVVAVATDVLVPAGRNVQADLADPKLVTAGKSVYASQCASCHGARLEGQPEWRTRRDDGRLPAPPHDATGHTWHHPDDVLFDIIKNGVGAKLPTRGRPNSRVISRHFDQGRSRREFMSRSKRPYGLTCSQINGVRAA